MYLLITSTRLTAGLPTCRSTTYSRSTCNGPYTPPTHVLKY